MSPLATPRPPLPERFEVLEELAHAEAELLLRARDKLLQREVVLRLPVSKPFKVREDKAEKDSALKSARALARIQNPNVVRLLDVIETPAGPLQVLEPVAGEALAERLSRDGRLDAEVVRGIALRLCDALAAVHAAGIVHRGISPGNVVLRPDGQPCLIGFSFAKLDASTSPETTYMYDTRGASGPTSAFLLPPTPAPEQVRGQTADARSDLFGLGWLLFQCLTGEEPFAREIAPEEWKSPRDLRALAPQTPKDLAAATTRLLQPSPLKRFASAKDLRAAIELAPVLAGAPAGNAGRRPKWIPLAAAAGVLAVGAAAWIALHGNDGGGGMRGDEPSPVARKDAAAQVFGATYASSHALLIGIKDYAGSGLRDLSNAENDVEAVAAQLDKMPWEHWLVRKLKGRDATREGIRTELSLLQKKVQPEDRVLIYYAGHGEASEQAESVGFVLPYGAESVKKDPGRSKWMSFTDFSVLAFDEMPAKHVLVAMDCCYGGRFEKLRGLAVREAYASKHVRKKARVVICAGQPNEQVSDGPPNGNSPFASAILDALRNPARETLTSSQLYGELLDKFEHVQGQTPELSGPMDGRDGQFVFFTRAR